eukprot:TRINITY_DN27054_c4_g1_i1.p1 TRINITY_DN27054_c4_g1~~TRINITY_DN27054_c4_g1_i1.p1  ORF type:complete len:483 (+),score=45.61 TRINITY_DN27054_c4_g1_i1:4703-6151(+)
MLKDNRGMEYSSNASPSVRSPGFARYHELSSEFVHINKYNKLAIDIKDVEKFFSSSDYNADNVQLIKAFLHLDSAHKKHITREEYINGCLEAEQALEKSIIDCEHSLQELQRQADKLNVNISDSRASENLNEYNVMEESILNLSVIEAKGFFPPDLRTNMSLYVVINVGQQQMVTSPSNTTLDPSWNAEFSFDIISGTEKIRLELFDLVSPNPKQLEAYGEISLEAIKDQLKHDMWLDLKNSKDEPISGRIHVFVQWVYSRVKYFSDILGRIQAKIADEKEHHNKLTATLSLLQEPYGFFRHFDPQAVEIPMENYSPAPFLVTSSSQQGAVSLPRIILPKPSKSFLRFDNILWMFFVFSTILTNCSRTDFVNTTVAVLGMATNALVIGKDLGQLVRLGLFTLTFAILFDILWIILVGGLRVQVKNVLTWINLGLKLVLFSRLKKKLRDAQLIALLAKYKKEAKEEEKESVDSEVQDNSRDRI